MLMHDTKLADEVERGRRAAELLDSELLREALDAIDAEVIAQWSDCPARDKDGKEALWQLYKTSKKFRGVLTGYVQTGRLASERMKDYDKPTALQKIFRAA
jgi:hypothetical protein